MRQNIIQVTHIDPATAVLAFHEVLPLVLRLATTTLADDLSGLTGHGSGLANSRPRLQDAGLCWNLAVVRLTYPQLVRFVWNRTDNQRRGLVVLLPIK